MTGGRRWATGRRVKLQWWLHEAAADLRSRSCLLRVAGAPRAPAGQARTEGAAASDTGSKLQLLQASAGPAELATPAARLHRPQRAQVRLTEALGQVGARWRRRRDSGDRVRLQRQPRVDTGYPTAGHCTSCYAPGRHSSARPSTARSAMTRIFQVGGLKAAVLLERRKIKLHTSCRVGRGTARPNFPPVQCVQPKYCLAATAAAAASGGRQQGPAAGRCRANKPSCSSWRIAMMCIGWRTIEVLSLMQMPGNG